MALTYNSHGRKAKGGQQMNIRFSFVRDEKIQGIEVTVRAANRNEYVETLLSELQEIAQRPINLRSFLDTYGININNVVLLMRDGRYVTAKTTTAEHVIKDALIHVEEQLDPAWFVRISQSEIVNLKYVKSWNFVGGGIVQIDMQNDIICYASRRYTARIRDRLRKREAV
jgi:DNA-binding LytR/AlgR family response regulator